uniref:Uncharacterized protein n=1 Tax=Anguilla anguilla TaxID=7936 RepID=A0A0E9V3J5_ANGAN
MGKCKNLIISLLTRIQALIFELLI